MLDNWMLYINFSIAISSHICWLSTFNPGRILWIGFVFSIKISASAGSAISFSFCTQLWKEEQYIIAEMHTNIPFLCTFPTCLYAWGHWFDPRERRSGSRLRKIHAWDYSITTGGFQIFYLYASNLMGMPFIGPFQQHHSVIIPLSYFPWQQTTEWKTPFPLTFSGKVNWNCAPPCAEKNVHILMGFCSHQWQFQVPFCEH